MGPPQVKRFHKLWAKLRNCNKHSTKFPFKEAASQRPNGKKNKKKSKLPDETLRVNPPQPTLPVKFLVSDPGIKVESLLTYEEMTIDELFNGPSRTWKGRKTIIRIARGKLQR